MNSESSWAEQIYSNFVLRDLAHVLAGGIFILSVEYALWSELIFFPQQQSLESVFFLLASYFSGLALYDFNNRFLPFFKFKLPEGYNTMNTVLQDLLSNYDTRVVNLYERMVCMRAAGIGIGAASFWGAILMGIAANLRLQIFAIPPSNDYSRVALVLILFGSYMIFYGSKMSRDLGQTHTNLIAGIKKS